MRLLSAFKRLRRRTVVVHLLSGHSLRGVLGPTYRDCIILCHAVHLDRETELDGELVIPRERIDFYQTVSA